MWRPLCTSCADARPMDLMKQASSRAPYDFRTSFRATKGKVKPARRISHFFI